MIDLRTGKRPDGMKLYNLRMPEDMTLEQLRKVLRAMLNMLEAPVVPADLPYQDEKYDGIELSAAEVERYGALSPTR